MFSNDEGESVLVFGCFWREEEKEVRVRSFDEFDDEEIGVRGAFWVRNSLSAANQSSKSLPFPRPRFS